MTGKITSANSYFSNKLQKLRTVVSFDAGLFALIALDSDALHDRTQELDEALQSLGLQPANRAGRPWAERQRGALKLLRNQAVLLVAQVLPTLAVILASPWLLFIG